MKESYPLKSLINQLQFNLAYALELILDVDEDDMTKIPAKGLENHPAFTIGHIITAYGLTIKQLGGSYTIKKEWDDLFRRKGPGDPRFPDLNKELYPSKTELILELNKQHSTLTKYLTQITEASLRETVTWRLSSFFPKRIDLIYFMCITHYAMHINQLAAWRRAMSLPSALSRM